MLKYLATIVCVACIFSCNSNGENTKAAAKKLVIEIFSRNLLIVRETFPKVPGFWEYATLHKKAERLRPKFWGKLWGFTKVFLNVVQIASIFIPPPVGTIVGVAAAVAEGVGDIATDLVGEGLEGGRGGAEGNEPIKVYGWFCNKPGLLFGCGGTWGFVDFLPERNMTANATTNATATNSTETNSTAKNQTTGKEQQSRTRAGTRARSEKRKTRLKVKSNPFDMTSKLLNEITDPNRTSRNHLKSVLQLMIKCKKNLPKMNHAAIMKQITLFTTNLLKITASLFVKSVEIPPS